MLFHQGPRVQRGRGLGAIFAAIARGIAPIARLGLKAGRSFVANPFVRKLGTSALDIAKQSAINLSADLIDPDKDIKKSTQEELDSAKRKIAATLRGGRKRKKHHQAKHTKKSKKVKYSLLD